MLKTFFIFLFFISNIYADKITLVADEWCPYNCKPENKNQGFLIDIATTIFEKEGHTIVYAPNIDWEDAIKRTRLGEFSAIIGTDKEEAPDFIFPENSQAQSANAFFVKKESKWQYTDIDSLQNVRLGIINGYSYGNRIDDYIKKNMHNSNKVQAISGNRAIYHNAKKLLFNSIDVMVEDPYVLDYYFHFNKEIMPFKKVAVIDFSDIYIAFSPKNPNSKKYAKILSDGMLEIKRSGELQKILDKYSIKSKK